MQLDFSAEGIHIPELGLWLDPASGRPAAWLSHAHSDHARGFHSLSFGTSQTLALYRERWPLDPETREFRSLEPGVPMDWNGAALTAYPAAHILGAAQLLIEKDGERTVYTGDIKLREPLCGDVTKPVPCDRLVVECTFGLPVFHFLSRDEAREKITAFARECLSEGVTPAFLGYPLGRGQEIVHVLTSAGIPVAVHGAIARYIPYYEAAGYSFPNWEPYDARSIDGRALVVVPGMRNILEAAGNKIRTAYVSGWAMFDNARLRSGADELIPYSDHADYAELIELVQRSGARRVDLVHGYTEPFATVLRNLGIEAVSHAGWQSQSRATAEDAAG